MRRASCYLLLSALLLLGAASGYGQTVTGTLQGRAVDQQGLAIPGVSITAKNEETGLERKTVTNDEGFYQMVFLPLGRYAVTAELSGFRPIVRRGIEVTLNQTTVVDFTLEVSELKEAVTVVAEAPAITITSGEIKRSLSEYTVDNIPLIDRNFLNLNRILPGFQDNPTAGQDNPTLSSGSSVNFNGTGTRGATFQTDGVNNDDSSENQHRQGVNVSTIKEFQVITNSYTAEFGRGFGAVVLVQTKSGTNDFRGDLYYFHRNGALAANSWFRNAAGASRRADGSRIPPQFIRHQYGFAAGGPIKKDSLFLFGSLDQVKLPGQGIRTVDILLPDERRPRVDPNDPFRVEKERWIQSVIDRFPNAAPNSPALGPRAFTATFPFKQPTEDYTSRVDWNATEKDHLFFRYQYSHQFIGAGAEVVRGERTVQNNRQQAFGFTASHVFSPRTVGEFRFGLGRRRTVVDIQDGNDTPIIRFVGTRFPSIIGNASAFPIQRFQTDFQYVYNFSTILGRRHYLKLGTDTRRQQLTDRIQNVNRGWWNFRPLGGFDAYENFLRGFVQQFFISFGPDKNWYRMFESNIYVQDDWKVTPSFTLNLGLRYELVTEPNEKFDLVELGYGADTDNFEPRFGFAWSPRAKEGWLRKLTGGPGNFVIRGGYGIFHGRIFQSLFSQIGASVRFNPPNAAFISLPTSNYDVNNPLGPDFVFRPGFPNFRTSLAIIDPDLEMPWTQQWNVTLERQFPWSLALSIGYNGNRGMGLLFYDWANRAEFPATAPNHPFVPAAFRGVTFNCVDPNPFNTNPPPGCISASQPRINERRPDPRWSNVLTSSNGSFSWYHGMQVTATKRLSHGLSFLASYTWSKAIDEGSEATFVGPGDINAAISRRLGGRSMRGPSRFDTRHRFTLNYSYELPFFKQQSGVIGRVLGGWQVSGVLAFVSGNPFTVFLGYDLNADGIGGDRPFIVDPSILGRSVDHPSRSQQQLPASPFLPGPNFRDANGRPILPFTPGSENIGNLGRNAFRMDGTSNWDLAIFKHFKVLEDHQLTLRFEIFNAANHPQFSFPDSTVAQLRSGSELRSSIFGRVSSLRSGTFPRQIQFALRYTF